MSNQKTFHTIYVVQIKGVTRNDFTPGIIKDTFDSVAEALQSQFTGTKIEVTEHDKPQGMLMVQPWRSRAPRQTSGNEYDKKPGTTTIAKGEHADEADNKNSSDGDGGSASKPAN